MDALVDGYNGLGLVREKGNTEQIVRLANWIKARKADKRERMAVSTVSSLANSKRFADIDPQRLG